jgi:hypothetical protein
VGDALNGATIRQIIQPHAEDAGLANLDHV